MRYSIIFMLLLSLLSCKPKEQTASSTSAATTPIIKDSTTVKQEAINCQTTGTLLESFNQNNSKFERFEIPDKKLEWLKITPQNGSCTILNDVREANHYSCRFEDWDGDGLKDRIDQGKWNYEVNLFSKEKNDFSRKINSHFCGAQWDFDKSKNLKFQFLESKFGGTYQLYSLKDTVITVYSEINLDNRETPEGSDPSVAIYKNGSEPTNADKTTFFIKAKSKDEDYKVMMERWKQSVERYWRKNLAQIVR